MRKFFLTVSTLFFLISCQSAKDAFTLKKKPSGDEFLVEKKSPLVLPPEYGKLPLPQEEQFDKLENNDEDIKNIISDNKNLAISNEKNSNETSIEKSILEKIK